jgi:hypothetical protein
MPERFAVSRSFSGCAFTGRESSEMAETGHRKVSKKSGSVGQIDFKVTGNDCPHDAASPVYREWRGKPSERVPRRSPERGSGSRRAAHLHDRVCGSHTSLPTSSK